MTTKSDQADKHAPPMAGEPIPAPVGSELTPNYFALHERDFEDLCASIFELEKHLCNVTRVDPAGRSQYGVDVRAHCREGHGEEVISCKREAKIGKQKVINWGDDFLKHWKTKWKAVGVRRFVLAVAEPISSGEAFEQLKIERKRFARKGIAYEVWGPIQLTERARGRPSILAQFYHVDWAAMLSEGSATLQTAEIRLLVSQGQSLSMALAQSTRKRIELARAGFRRGDWQGLDRELGDICDDATLWRELPSTERARVWQLRADRLFFQDRLSEAARAIEEVERHDASASGLLRAQLAAAHGDVPAAIDLLTSSTDVAHRRMRAQFRLAQGDVGGALADLDEIDSSDVDAQRLRAISLLVAGESMAAWAALKTAQAIASDNYWVRHTEMRLCYAAALSPIAPGRVLMFPTLVHPWLVREDPDAVAALERCAEIARSLELLPIDPEEHRELKLWRLAALCFHPDRRDAARALAQELLAEVQSIETLIPWLLHYDFSFESTQVEQSLREALKSTESRVEHLGGLLALLQAAKREEDALGLLNEFAPRFPIHAALTAGWRHSLEMSTSALAPLDASEPSRLIATAPDTNNVLAWIGACESLVRQQRWTDLAPAVALLLETFASAPATAIALQIVSLTEGPAAFLNFLELHRTRFHGTQLPHGLRQSRINALTKLGRLVEAQTEALALAYEGRDVIDRLNAIAVSHHLGDDSTILQQARALTPGALDAHGALRVAHTLSTIDPPLARRFWDHAWSLGVPDEHAPEAAMLGIQLEVGSAMRKVMQQFQRYAVSGASHVVTVHSVDEVVRFIAARREQSEQLHTQWRNGVLPIHALTTNPGEFVDALYRIFHATPRRAPSWYIHSGARLNRPTDVPQALVLDTTAVLSAWHLDLMGPLEQCGIPLLLSPSLPQVLKDAKDSLMPHQPAVVRARTHVIEAIESNRIRVADSPTWLHVGFYVEGSPRPGANLRWLAEALSHMGVVDREQMEVLIDRLGTYGEEPIYGPDDKVTEIVIDAAALRLIAEGPELNSFLDHFTVAVTTDDAAQLRSAYQSARAQESVVENLERLQRRVLDGIHAGRYTLLERNYRKAAASTRVRDASLLLQAALELFELEVPDGAWLWFDDRLFHSVTDSPVPCVSSVDVIRWLKDVGRVSATHEIRLRRKLFTNGAAFIALEVDEVIDALAHPDANLPLLAQTHLRGIQDASVLRLAAAAEQPAWSESAYSFRELTLAPRVIGRLWADASIPDDLASTRAAQAWNAFGCSWWSADEAACTSQIAERVLMLQLAGLLLDPVTWALDPKVRFKRMEAYGKWLDQCLIQPLLERNPSLAQLLIDHLVPLVCQLLAVSDSHADENRAFTAHITRWLTYWPDALRDAAFTDGTLRTRLAVLPQRWVNIGKGHVSGAEFASAIALAMTEGYAEIRVLPAGDRAKIVVSREAGRLPSLTVEGDAHYPLDDNVYLFASPIPDDRTAALRAHPEYWETEHTSAGDAVHALYGCSDPLTRIDRLEAMRERSPAYRYQRLSLLVNAHETVEMEEFRPTNVRAQLAYLRLRSDDARPWMQQTNDAAETLVVTVGLFQAVLRYAAFPSDLPSPLLRAVAELGATEREALIDELSGSASPVHRVHGILLALRSEVSRPGTIAVWIEHGQAAMDELVQGYGWLLAEFAHDDPYVPNDVRIAAWSHLGSLLHALPQGLDLKLLRNLGKMRRATVLRAHLRSRKPSGDLLDFDSVLRPRQLFAATLCACLRVGPLAAFDAETSARTQTLLSVANSDIALPHPELLPRMQATNVLDSWLAMPFSELAQALNWPLLAGYEQELTRSFRAHALEELEKDPDAPEAWMFSINIAPAADWEHDAKKRILAVATKADPVTLRSRSEEKLWPEIINLLVILCSTDEERAIVEGFLNPGPDAGNQPLRWVESLVSFHATDDVHAALQRVANWLLRWAESGVGSEKYVRQVLNTLESVVSVAEAGALRQVRLAVGFV